MNTIQMQYIIEAVHTGSFNKAAQNLFVTQSAVSLAIQNLEEEFGITIFNRTAKGVTLTDEGKEFMFYANNISEQISNIKRICSPKEKKERLRIVSAGYQFAQEALLSYLDSLDSDMHFNVFFSEKNMTEIIHGIGEKEYDIGIISLSDLSKNYFKNMLVENYIEYHELASVPFHVFMSASHPLASFDCIEIEQLRNFPCLIDLFGSDLFYNECTRVLTFNPTDRVIYVDQGLVEEIILANTEAYSIGSGILTPKANEGKLVSKPIKNSKEKMAFGWIKRDDMPMSDSMQKYINIVEKMFLSL